MHRLVAHARCYSRYLVNSIQSIVHVRVHRKIMDNPPHILLMALDYIPAGLRATTGIPANYDTYDV